jgi:hypothetical protein
MPLREEQAYRPAVPHTPRAVSAAIPGLGVRHACRTYLRDQIVGDELQLPEHVCRRRGRRDRRSVRRRVIRGGRRARAVGVAGPDCRAGCIKGYTYLSETFLPKLRKAGVDEATIDKLTRENPFHAFARPS